MQIWIHFIAGAGGDGFANLLEWSDNVETIDSDKTFKRWRVQHWVNNSPKFWAPKPDANRVFRNYQPFKFDNNYLQKNYCRLVNSNINTICTSHDVHLIGLKNSDNQTILQKNRIDVLVTHPDYVEANRIANIKNLISAVDPINPLVKPLDLTQFDFVISIIDIQKDWSTVENFCHRVGLKLDKKYYTEYQKIQQGSTELLSYNSSYVPKKFVTSTNNGITTYTEI